MNSLSVRFRSVGLQTPTTPKNLQQPPLPWQHKKTRRLAGFAFNALLYGTLKFSVPVQERRPV